MLLIGSYDISVLRVINVLNDIADGCMLLRSME